MCFHQTHVMISSLVAVSQADKACEPIRALQGWKRVGVLSWCQSEKKWLHQWMTQTASVLITCIHEKTSNAMTNANLEGSFRIQLKALLRPTNESVLIYCERINTLPP